MDASPFLGWVKVLVVEEGRVGTFRYFSVWELEHLGMKAWGSVGCPTLHLCPRDVVDRMGPPPWGGRVSHWACPSPRCWWLPPTIWRPWPACRTAGWAAWSSYNSSCSMIFFSSLEIDLSIIKTLKPFLNFKRCDYYNSIYLLPCKLKWKCISWNSHIFFLQNIHLAFKKKTN